MASAVGAIDNPTPLVADDTAIPDNQGTFGQGGAIAIGDFGGAMVWVVSGPLQWSLAGGSGNAWNVIYDPDDPDVALRASKVVFNKTGSILGFAWGSDDTTLGYAILD